MDLGSGTFLALTPLLVETVRMLPMSEGEEMVEVSSAGYGRNSRSIMITGGSG